jgi:hypothetical protein
LETAFTIFTTIAAWDAYGPGWGDTGTLLKQDWSWEPLPAFNGVCESSTLYASTHSYHHLFQVAAMAQSFYIWRIWTLKKSIWVPILFGYVSARDTLRI